jgi:hypothetical protein
MKRTYHITGITLGKHTSHWLNTDTSLLQTEQSSPVADQGPVSASRHKAMPWEHLALLF